MWWIVTLSLLGMAALAAGAALSGGHYEGQHAAGPDLGPADWPSDIGSMDLEAERTFPGWWPAPPVDPEPWCMQTAAELGPEARDPLSVMGDFFAATPDPGPLTEVVLPDAGGWISGPCIGPGPGEAPSDPGPGQYPPELACAVDHGGEPCPGYPDPPARHSDLGPGARAVLARYDRRFRERWACPWLDLGGLT